MSEITKRAKKKRNILLAAQLAVMLGTAATLIILAIRGIESGGETFAERFGTLITSMCITLGITGLLLVVVGHKIRATIWMICLLMASYLFGTSGMWAVFGVWGLDEYVLYPLYKTADEAVRTNKIIDKREGTA